MQWPPMQIFCFLVSVGSKQNKDNFLLKRLEKKFNFKTERAKVGLKKKSLMWIKLFDFLVEAISTNCFGQKTVNFDSVITALIFGSMRDGWI